MIRRGGCGWGVFTICEQALLLCVCENVQRRESHSARVDMQECGKNVWE